MRKIIDNALLEEALRSKPVDWDRYLQNVWMLSDDPNRPAAIRFEPYPYQRTLLDEWYSGGDYVMLKGRQLGFSWLVAMYMLYRAMYSGWAIGYYSRGDEESKHELSQRVEFIYNHLPPELKRPSKFIENLATFESGGSIRAFPGTRTAGVGYTFQLVVFDEFAMHAFGSQNFAAVLPTTQAGGQVLVMSTSNPDLGPAGPFFELWMSDSPLWKKRFFPWDVAPGRDADWYNDQLQRFAGDERSFRAFNPASVEDAFAGKGLLVHPDFNEVVHMKQGLPWDQYRYRLAGVDWGGTGDPAGIVPLGVTRDEKFHQPGEFFRNTTTTIDDMADYLFRLHNVAPFDIIACGLDEPVATATLRSMGLPAYPANTKRVEGLGMVDMLLRERRLTIDPRCKQTRYQFLTYQNRVLTDPNTRERYTTRTPVDHHADLMDAQRYAVMAYWAKSPRPQSGARPMVFV